MQKVMTITGGNSGIGRAVVERYLKEGYRVASFNRTIGEMNNFVTDYGNSFIEFKGDVRNTVDLQNFYSRCHKEWHKIDIVIANAGIAEAQTIEKVTQESFDKTLAINISGVFFTVQKSLPYLSTSASISLISSIQANKGDDMWCAYGASKAAVRSMTRSLAQGLANQGIRVNCISPGVTKTAIFEKMGIDSKKMQEMLKAVAASTPLERLGEPKDIVNLLYFINSDKASFITGADFQADGGLTQI